MIEHDSITVSEKNDARNIVQWHAINRMPTKKLNQI